MKLIFVLATVVYYCMGLVYKYIVVDRSNCLRSSLVGLKPDRRDSCTATESINTTVAVEVDHESLAR